MKHHDKCVAFIRQITLILLSHFTIVRAAYGTPDGLLLFSAAATYFHSHSNATRAPIANPANSAQWRGGVTVRHLGLRSVGRRIKSCRGNAA